MVEADIICKQCNSSLELIIDYRNRNKKGKLHLEPCHYCLEKANKHGYTSALSHIDTFVTKLKG